jgi:hypothetical protein
VAAVTAMAPVWRMVGISVGSWLLTAPWFEPAIIVALLTGMLGPLAMAVGTWLMTERTYRRNPERVTAVMIAGFGVKVMFVALYLVLMLRGFRVQPTAFVTSFTTYFIVLYAIEALYLKRLFAGGLEVSR